MSLYEFRIVGRVQVWRFKNGVKEESCCYRGKEARLDVMSNKVKSEQARKPAPSARDGMSSNPERT